MFGRRSRTRQTASPASSAQLAGFTNAREADEAARDPGTAPEMLKALAEHQDPRVRMEVAWNISTSPAVLDSLARDRYAVVRSRVAGNPNTDAEALGFLADDPVEPLLDVDRQWGVLSGHELELELIKKHVAQHPSAPVWALRYLAATGFASEVAANSSAPPDLLAKLAHGVLDSFVEKEDRLDQIDERIRVERLLAPIARNPSTSPATLVTLGEGHWCDEGIAGNPSTPPQILLELAQRWHRDLGHMDQCVALARNPSLPDEAVPLLRRVGSLAVDDELDSRERQLRRDGPH